MWNEISATILSLSAKLTHLSWVSRLCVVFDEELEIYFAEEISAGEVKNVKDTMSLPRLETFCFASELTKITLFKWSDSTPPREDEDWSWKTEKLFHSSPQCRSSPLSRVKCESSDKQHTTSFIPRAIASCKTSRKKIWEKFSSSRSFNCYHLPFSLSHSQFTCHNFFVVFHFIFFRSLADCSPRSLHFQFTSGALRALCVCG